MRRRNPMPKPNTIMPRFPSPQSERGGLLASFPRLLLGILALLALHSNKSYGVLGGATRAPDGSLTIRLTGPANLPADASHDLHPSLASFSIETAFFETFVGNTSSPNLLTRRLLETLQQRTGTPAEIRIGGITADSTYWNSSLGTSSFNFIDSTGALHNTTIGPGFWESVGLLPEGTKVTMNLVRFLRLRFVSWGSMEVSWPIFRGCIEP
jgi:hypothetical protein